MITLTALAQFTESVEWTPLFLVLLTGAMALVLGMARLLRRMLGMLTRVLVSAGAALTGVATMLALCGVLSAIFFAYAR